MGGKKITRRQFLRTTASIGLIASSIDIVSQRSSYPEETGSAPRKETISICAGGDCTLGGVFDRYFDRVSVEEGEDRAFKAPFEKIKEYFSQSDISFVNLEGVLTGCEKIFHKDHRFNFRGDPKYARCLVEGGVNAVSLANNHFLDFGKEGAIETIDTLERSGISYFGGGKDGSLARRPLIIERKGIKVAFLGFNKLLEQKTADFPCTNPYFEGFIRGQIEEAKSIADIVIVSLHWGHEYQAVPAPFQGYDAESFIDAGADAIIGHHPHVVQGVSEYKKGLIFYSIGNLVFGGNVFPKEREAMLARIEFSKEGVERYETIPLLTHPSHGVFQPYKPDDEREILAIEERISKRSLLLKNMGHSTYDQGDKNKTTPKQ